MKRALAGVGSLVLLVALLVGVPLALVIFAGNPFPTWAELVQAATMPDWGGRFLIGTVLPLIGWIAWLTFAIGAVAEIPAQIQQVPAPHLPGLGAQQKAAGALIGAVIILFTGMGVASPSSASAVEPTTPTHHVSASAVHDASSHVSAEQSAEASDQNASESAPTYVVQDGDSLWRIAEAELGQGERWQEIAELNYGITQENGWALTGQNWLNSGWVLILPEDAASTGDTAAAEEEKTTTQHTVVAGETLWDISEKNLGDGAQYPRIFNASKGITQPDGQKLTDPDLIRPGWVLNIPTSAPPAPADSEGSPTEDAPEEQPAPPSQSAPHDATSSSEAPTDESASGPESATEENPGSQQKESSASSSAEPQGELDDWIDEIFNVRTIGGIGAIAAAGLLSVLGIRRMKQRRRRRPGQRIAMPVGEASTMEMELRAVENPMGMEDVDHALRHLAVWAQSSNASLPPLYALRLADDEIALYLDEPTELPEPFFPVAEDKTAWSVDPERLPELDRIPSSPWPALVTLGQDQGDAHLMVDLEHIGALNLVGNEESVSGALTGLAVELSTSQWGEDLQITLVGIAPGLPAALDTGRVRHIDDIDTLLLNLRAQATSTEETLAELGVTTIEEARSLGAFSEAWTPEIVILGELPDDAARAEIADLVSRVPRVGVAAVSSGNLVGEWTMTLSDDRTANLNIPAAGAGLPLTPQIVNEAELTKILGLFRTTEDQAVQHNQCRDEVALDDIPVHTPTSTTEEVVLEAEQATAEADQIAVEDGKLPAAPDVKEQEPFITEVKSASGDSTVPESHVEFDPDVPWIQLLGPVKLHNAQGPEPRTPQTSEINRSAVARSTELLAFLSLNPGASAVTVHDALWPGKIATGKSAQQSRNGLASKARKWIGISSDAQEWFPKVGAQGYRLRDGVRTDWHIWLDLIGDDLSITPTENLIAALRLVRGQPFSGVREKYYRWAEVLRTEMIQAIGDAAHELVTRSLRTGRIADARLAATVGRQIDPVNETLWRDAMRAESLAGDKDGFERLVNQHEDELDSFEDGYEPETETVELIEQIRGRLTLSN